MKQHNRNLFITSLALCFMYSTIFRSVFNLLSGYPQSSNIFNLQLLLFLFIIEGINLLLMKLPFKNYFSFMLTEAIISYPIYLISAYIFHWFDLTDIKMLLIMTLCFAGIFVLIAGHFYRRDREDADDINNLIP